MEIGSTQFWLALAEIIGVNIVLSGDNAVVIALAARGLPAHQQKKAVAWGSGAAVVMRIVLTMAAVRMLQFPGLKLVGAIALVWIAVQLLLPEEGGDSGHAASSSLWTAIRTILIADLVMSLDNVIAVAAAAHDDTLLLIVGLGISIPLVIFASQILLKLMERYPIIITLGAGLLGYVAGEMLVTDPLVKDWVHHNAPWLHWAAPIAGAILVLLLGRVLAGRKGQKGLPGLGAQTGADAQATAAAQPAPATGPDAATASATAMSPAWRRVLLAVDGSTESRRALDEVLRMKAAAGGEITVDLVNVQRPVPGVMPGVATSRASIEQYHREKFEAATAQAIEQITSAGIAVTEHLRVGQPGEEIARMARELGSDVIVLGARGLGSFTGRAVGSVALGTIEHAQIPVLVVKGR